MASKADIVPLNTSETLPEDFPGFFPSDDHQPVKNKVPNEDLSSTPTNNAIALPSATVLLATAAAIIIAPVLAVSTLALLGLKELEETGLVKQLNVTQGINSELNTSGVASTLEYQGREVSQLPDLSNSLIMKEVGATSTGDSELKDLLLGGTGATIVEHEVPTSVVETKVESVTPSTVGLMEQEPLREKDQESNHSIIIGTAAGVVAGLGGLALFDSVEKPAKRPRFAAGPDSEDSTGTILIKTTESSTPTITSLSQIERTTSYSTPIENINDISSSNGEDLLSRPYLQSRFSDSTFSPSILSSTSNDEDENPDSFKGQTAYSHFGETEVLGDEPRLSSRPLDTPLTSQTQILSPSEPEFPNTTEATSDREDFTGLGLGTGAGLVGAGLMSRKLRSPDSQQTSSGSSSPSPFQFNRIPSSQDTGPTHHGAAEYAQAHRTVTPPSAQRTPESTTDLAPSRIYSTPSNSQPHYQSNSVEKIQNHSASNSNSERTPSQLLNYQLNSSSNNPNPVEHSPHLHIATRVDSISGRKKLHKDSLNRDSTITASSNGRARSKSVTEGSANGRRRYASESYANSNNRESYVERGHGNENVPSSDLWKSSMAQVVNDETANRGGQRPAFVTIDTEDRRERIPPADSRQIHYQSNLQSNGSDGTNLYDSNNSNSLPSTPQDTKKLTKNRRASVSNIDRERYYDQNGNGRSGSPASQGKKEGFLHKVFGRHNKSGSSTSH